MGQRAIFVTFPADFPRAADVVRVLGGIVDVTVEIVVDTPHALTLRLGDKELVGIEYERPGRAYIEVDFRPSLFQWAVVEALERLGGEPGSHAPPSVKRKLG